MKEDIMRRAIVGIDDKLIEDADASPRAEKRTRVWTLIAAAVLAVAMLIAGAVIAVKINKDPDVPGTDSHGTDSPAVTEKQWNVQLVTDNITYLAARTGTDPTGSPIDEYSPDYTKDFRKVEHMTKINMPNLNLSILGKEYNLFYFETHTTKISDYGKDLYTYSLNHTGYHAYVNSKTGKLVFFNDITAGRNHEYISSVNPESSASEFIAYASSILSEYMDISTEGWNVEITTEKHVSDEHWGLLERKYDFVKYEVDPDIDVSYTINFYRYLNDKCEGIRLADTVYVKMTSYGEVVEFCGEVFDDKYIPYKDIDLDVDKIVSVFENEDEYTDADKYIEPTMTLRAIAYNNELWVEATIRYKHYSGKYISERESRYVMKVAEIIE